LDYSDRERYVDDGGVFGEDGKIDWFKRAFWCSGWWSGVPEKISVYSFEGSDQGETMSL
jgi:hypothetical protein